MKIFILACTIFFYIPDFLTFFYLLVVFPCSYKARVGTREELKTRAAHQTHKHGQARAQVSFGVYLPGWLAARRALHSNVWVECVCAHVEFSGTPLAHIYVLASAKLSFSVNSQFPFFSISNNNKSNC